jgi:hypothetical protein
MSITPTAGTYWCSFTSSIQITDTTTEFQLWITLNDVQSVTAGENFEDTGPQSVYLTWIVSIPGGQAVTVQWARVNGGSGTALVGIRTLFCIQIG